MSTDANLLMGEVIPEPALDEREIDYLMRRFLKALVQEEQEKLFHD